MKPSTGAIITAALFLSLPTTPPSAAQLPPNFAVLSKAVVRMNNLDCTGSAGNISTGFIYHDKASVVTALHAVRNCRTFRVDYDNGAKQKAAHIARIDRAADLALLTVDDPIDVRPLEISDREPALTDPLQVLGFPLQIPTMSSTSLHLRFGGTRLRDIVPTQVRNDLASVGSPSIDLTITNIEGHLLPGLSGAPIFNSSNRVVAVGDGGLSDGASGISWGIPAAALPRLLQSNDSLPAAARTSAALFSAELDAVNGGEVTCSGQTLVRFRTALPFSQIYQSADDVTGLGFLMGYFNSDPSLYTFDVYQNLASGATIVLPAGATLKPDAKGCVANLSGNQFTLRVELGKVSDPSQLQALSVQQEVDIVGGATQNWYPDTTFTYSSPRPRFDGLAVRRRAYAHGTFAASGPSVDSYVFETIVTRNNVLLSSSIRNNRFSPDIAQAWAACRTTPLRIQGCESLRAWIGGVLSVHLTTFPIG